MHPFQKKTKQKNKTPQKTMYFYIDILTKKHVTFFSNHGRYNNSKSAFI